MTGNKSLTVDEYTIYHYLQTANAGYTIGNDRLDNENLIDDIIISAINQQYPHVPQIQRKNIEYFYDNTVYYYGKPGYDRNGEDFRVVMSPSFFNGITFITRSPHYELVTLLPLYIAYMNKIFVIEKAEVQPVAASPQLGRLAMYIRAATILTSIVTVLLLTFSSLLIRQGFTMLPLLISSIALLAISLLSIQQRRKRRQG